MLPQPFDPSSLAHASLIGALFLKLLSVFWPTTKMPGLPTFICLLLALLSSAAVISFADARLSAPLADGGGPVTGAGAGVYLPSQVTPGRPRDLRVMIMTHNRPASVERLIEQVIALAKKRLHRLHIVVSQSAAGPDAENVAALRKTLAALRAKHGAREGSDEGGKENILFSLAHVLAPYIRTDESFSVNRKAHGSKRNSVYNMLVGLDVAFTGKHSPPPSFKTTGGTTSASGDDFAAALSAAIDDSAAKDNGPSSTDYSAAKELSAYRRGLEERGFLAASRRSLKGTSPSAGDGKTRKKKSASFPDAPLLDYAAKQQKADLRKEGLASASEHPVVITLEDDVKLSPDALDYFSFAQDLMASEQTDAAAALAVMGKQGEAVPAAAPYVGVTLQEQDGLSPSDETEENDSEDPVTPLNDGAVHFATAFALFRPSLLVGQDDVGFIRSRLEKQGVFSTAVHRLLGSPRSVFKTLAWSCDVVGYRKLRALLASVAAYEPSPWRARVEAAVRDANEVATAVRTKAAGFLGSNTEAFLDEVSSTARFLVFRSGHPELALSSLAPTVPKPNRRTEEVVAPAPAPWSCWGCNDYCYDHAIEWILQRQPFLAPALPRVTQQKGSGMTSVTNDENEYYQGQVLSGQEEAMPGLGGPDSLSGKNSNADSAAGAGAEAVAKALALAAIPPHELAAKFGYHLREWPLYWTTSLLFRTPGLSAVSPPLPEEGDNGELAAVVRLEQAVRELRAKSGLSASSQPDERVLTPLLQETLASLKTLATVPSGEVLVLYSRERVILLGIFPAAVILVLLLLGKVVSPAIATLLGRKQRYQDLIVESKKKGTGPAAASAAVTTASSVGRRGSIGGSSAGLLSGRSTSTSGASGAFLLEAGGGSGSGGGRKSALSGLASKED